MVNDMVNDMKLQQYLPYVNAQALKVKRLSLANAQAVPWVLHCTNTQKPCF